MSELPPGEQAPESSENRRMVDQAADLAKTTFGVIKSILFITPLVIVVIVVALALMGPAIGNIFSNVVTSL